MTSVIISFAVLVVGFAAPVNGQSISLDCPYVTPIRNIDLTVLVGQWYMILSTWTKPYECVEFIILENQDGTLGITQRGAQPGGEIQTDTYIFTSDSAFPGFLYTNNDDSVIFFAMDIQDGYAVYLDCPEDSNNDEWFVAAIARTPSITRHATNILSKIITNITDNEQFRVNQADCKTN